MSDATLAGLLVTGPVMLLSAVWLAGHMIITRRDANRDTGQEE